jgi:XTP/dITP diphosphohydrolase
VTRRIVLLVTSPRLPAGLLTVQAWDLVRSAPVFAATQTPQTEALTISGVHVEIIEPRSQILLDRPEPVLVWLSSPDGDESFARELGLRLSREPGQAELELMYGSWDPPGARLLDAVTVTDRLHLEDPWKREQTHRSLAKYLIEEAYEANDAILNDDHEQLRAEMGDVLLQVLLHSRIAEELPEDERWSIDDVAGDFVAKMIRRNPHVFGGDEIHDVGEVMANWDRIKAEEKAGQSTKESVTWSLPALIIARKLLQRTGASKPEPDGTFGGDLLALIASSDEDPEEALRQALRRYAENV